MNYNGTTIINKNDYQNYDSSNEFKYWARSNGYIPLNEAKKMLRNIMWKRIRNDFIFCGIVAVTFFILRIIL
ncbi:hypothetical protein LCGC14_0407060 [marine sediment metagenome]|uniref:Uncharacterized protein n=1 Tax=marine sediment metagenome TaxID=412755 RepID=A0A0F9VH76_9ZZZZ